METLLTLIVIKLRSLGDRLRRDGGQTLAEYGILVSVIAVVVIIAVLVLGGNVSTLFSSSAQKI